jgi:aminoglycoside phosphotransferase (APT) family kinase protein
VTGARPLASGRDADVFALSADRVLRRYRDPQKSTAVEAAVMRYVREHGLPVPEVYDADGPDLVMQRVTGPTMATVAVGKPWLARRLIKQLAELHRQVHSIVAPAELPRACEGDALLHLDLHPDNVILTRNGPVIIDWTNAAGGDPALDVADIWLLLSIVEVPGGYLRNRIGTRLARMTVDTFARESGLEFRHQVATAAMRRLFGDRNMSDNERQRLQRMLDDVNTA